jgi:ectoine hydroxylase-related dioxygenase (phytanoyl-CoA dioxygenase family)
MQYSELALGDCVKEFNAFTAARQSVPPKTGMLLIFPSWLVHNVTRNNSGEDRISFAFDVKVSGKKNQW